MREMVRRAGLAFYASDERVRDAGVAYLKKPPADQLDRSN